MRFGIAGFTVVLDEQAMLAGYGHKSRREGLWCTCEHFCWLGLSCNSFAQCMHACGRGAGWCTWSFKQPSWREGKLSAQHSNLQHNLERVLCWAVGGLGVQLLWWGGCVTEQGRQS
jgi:hypothetical protein